MTEDFVAARSDREAEGFERITLEGKRQTMKSLRLSYGTVYHRTILAIMHDKDKVIAGARMAREDPLEIQTMGDQYD